MFAAERQEVPLFVMFIVCDLVSKHNLDHWGGKSLAGISDLPIKKHQKLE